VYSEEIHREDWMIRLLAALSLSFSLCSSLAMAQKASETAPPLAPEKDHRDVRHGVTTVDPYFWLR
jgi:hypothetical protein